MIIKPVSILKKSCPLKEIKEIFNRAKHKNIDKIIYTDNLTISIDSPFIMHHISTKEECTIHNLINSIIEIMDGHTINSLK